MASRARPTSHGAPTDLSASASAARAASSSTISVSSRSNTTASTTLILASAAEGRENFPGFRGIWVTLVRSAAMELQLPAVLAANEAYQRGNFHTARRTPQPARHLVILT